MKKILSSRPSPALVIALIALFVALGGTSYAALILPKNSVGTKQLKKGAVTSPKIAKGVVPTVMSAVVNADGTPARSSPGVTSSKSQTGGYNVVFSRDVTQCAYTATIGQPGNGAIQGDIDVASLNTNPKGVFVETLTSDGASDADKPFHLVVVC